MKLNAQAICLLTQSLSPNVEALILKEHGVPMDAHLLCKYIKEKFSETTAVQDSREADYLTKPVRPVWQTGQTDLLVVCLSKEIWKQALRGLLHQEQDNLFRKQVKVKKRSACPR